MSELPQIVSAEERRQRNHEEVAQQILRVAREVMREHGVGDLNLQEVARRVGMRAPSLYNYYPNRTAIYDALFTREMRHYRERQMRVWAQDGDIWERTEWMIESHLAFAAAQPELFQLLFERPVPGFVPSADGLKEAGLLMESARRVSEEVLASGEVRATVGPDVMANLMMAIMHGIAASHLANEPHLPPDSGRFGRLIPVVMSLLKSAWAANPGPDQAGP